MTYFLRDDTGPFDLMADLELDAITEARVLAVNHGREVGCLFPTAHDPRHPVDLRVHVAMDDPQGRASEGREALTEAEIQARFDAGCEHFMSSSQWDFWWD